MANLILRWSDDVFESDFSKPERYAADVSRGVEYAGGAGAASRPAEAEHCSSPPPPSPLDDDDDDAPTSTSSLSSAMGDQLGEDCAREKDGAVGAADCCAINAMSKGIF